MILNISLCGVQESLKQFSSALNEDPEQVLSAQGLPRSASPAPQRQAAPRQAASAADWRESGTQGAHTREGDRVSRAGGDRIDLFRQAQPDGAGLLDTSATLADWILRSTSSSAPYCCLSSTMAASGARSPSMLKTDSVRIRTRASGCSRFAH